MSVESMNVSSVATNLTATTAKPAGQQVAAQAQVAQHAEQARDSQKLTAEEMQGVVDKLNEFMHSGQRNLNFSVDNDTDEVVIKVMNTDTQEVIRQFPSEEALKLTKHIEGMMGLIFNDHA